MIITAISDTHFQHHALRLEGGDMLIHAGDVSRIGRELEITEFLDWFSRQDYTHKIFIAGNHDYFFERTPDNYIRTLIPDNVIYLNDSGVTVDGINIWGSPVQPWFFDWAFNRQRGEEIDRHWQLIPDDTDILITHGPAYGILDMTKHGEQVGCQDLLRKIEEVKPSYHIAGHIHEAFGTEQHGETTFINASVLNEKYKMANEPVVFEVDE